MSRLMLATSTQWMFCFVLVLLGPSSTAWSQGAMNPRFMELLPPSEHSLRLRNKGQAAPSNVRMISAAEAAQDTDTAAVVTYLSDMQWIKADNGWGPVEVNRSNGDQQAADGQPITVGGVVYQKGLGVHAPSDVRYALGGRCSTFSAVVGVDDEVATNGSVIFQVSVDGVQRYQSAVITGAAANQAISVDVTGANELALIVSGGSDNFEYDHADWGDAKVACKDPATPAVTGTAIYPGEDIQEQVNASPAGTTFVLKAGYHRMQTISPKEGNVFSGEVGAIVSGASLLTNFGRSGSYFVATGQTQQGVVHGYCEDGYPGCQYPEELFIDDQRLIHVDSLAAVAPGKWFFDYAADAIYFSDDPAGHRVETSVTTSAFLPTANNVTLSNLIVEKYANLAQYGPINAENTRGWVLSGNEVRLNHGGGIRIGHTARLIKNNVHHNGQMGIGGIGDDVLVEDNEIAYNNGAHFNCMWECGGTKFVLTKRLVVRKNFIHHNDGPGLWTDIDNIDTLFEENRVEDNGWMGIVHEISFAAIIRNNTVLRNGFAFPGWAWGAGILVAASPNVEIYGNVVDNNADGITVVQQARGEDSLGPHETANVWVHDNTITMPQGWTGMVQDIGDDSYFTSRNNRFDRNIYHFPDGAAAFVWMDGERNESQWRAYGLDVNGTFGR
jgi:NPCBM/NEW2 domain/Right handed beta helix region